MRKKELLESAIPARALYQACVVMLVSKVENLMMGVVVIVRTRKAASRAKTPPAWMQPVFGVPPVRSR